MVLSDT